MSIDSFERSHAYAERLYGFRCATAGFFRLRLHLPLLLLAMFVIFAVQAYAQLDTSTISGTVSDSSGAVVPGATVVITNAKTNRSFSTTTNSKGEYFAPSLSVSVYQLTFSKRGFRTTSVEGVILHANDSIAENAVLQIGAATETITVQADAIHADTETSNLGATITADQVAKLPLNGRDFTALLALVPGAVQNTGDAVNRDSLGGFASGQNGANMLVDGTDATRVDGNTTFSTFGRGNARITRSSVDNIQEIKVISSAYSAEYGRAVGEIVNVITKSGSNQFHGEVFEFLRNDALDAKNYFYIGTAVPLRLNQFGGNFGGPIIRNKLFFFGNYEGVRQHVTNLATGYNLVLNQAMRAKASPSMAPIIAKIPLGNGGPARTVGHIKYGYWFDVLNGSTYNNINENTAALKLDYVLSQKNNFSVRYNYNASDTYGTYGLAIGQYANAPQLSQLGKATWNYVGSSSFLNEAGFAINSPHSHQDAGEPGFPIMNCFFCNIGFGTVPNPQLWASKEPAISYQAIDTATKIIGRNQLRFGLDIRWNKVGRQLETQDSIYFTGGPTVEAASDFPCNGQDPNTTGCVDASGGPEGFLANSGIGWSRQGYPLTYMKNVMMGYFIQDDWKVRKNLTLNLGLRYDHNTVLHDEAGVVQNFDLATLSLLPPKTPFYEPSWVDFAPRIGFNWDPTGRGLTSIKGGFGLFFLPISAGSPLNLSANTQENFSINLLSIAFAGVKCNPQLTSIQFPLPTTAPDCNPKAPASMTAFDKHQLDTYSEQWNLAVDQQVAKNTVVTASYRGNHGIRLPGSTDQNTYDPNKLSGQRYLSDLYAGISLQGQIASSNYNAFNVSVRTNAYGLNLQGNYNYARQYDDAMGLFEAYQNPRDIKADWSRADGDVRHSFSFGGVYDAPRVPKIPKAIGAGWQLSAIVQGRAGAPVNFSYNDQSDTFPIATSRRPDCTGISPKATKYSTPTNQFNLAAFAPDKGNFGTCPRNYGIGPGFIQPDLNLMKNTKLTEHVNWEFRVEFFDFVNHPNFGNPGTGVFSKDRNSPLQGGYVFGASPGTIGNLIGIGTSRQIQLASKITF